MLFGWAVVVLVVVVGCSCSGCAASVFNATYVQSVSCGCSGCAASVMIGGVRDCFFCPRSSSFSLEKWPPHILHVDAFCLPHVVDANPVRQIEGVIVVVLVVGGRGRLVPLFLLLVAFLVDYLDPV